MDFQFIITSENIGSEDLDHQPHPQLMPKGSYRASDKHLSIVLRTEQKLYKIPRYQRNYSWKKAQIETLWNDLLEDREKTSNGLFIGTILLCEGESEDERVEVIDGQQRLITLTILLASLRDAFQKLQDFGTADQIHRNYIADSEYAGSDKIPRLVAGGKLQGFLFNHIQHYPRGEDYVATPAESEEQKNVKSCKSFFDREIKKELRQIPDHVERIAWLVSVVNTVEKVNIISIDVEFEEDAYAVFESVNAKGMDLTLADLLKNLIFRNLKPNEEGKDTAQRQWDQIIENLDGTGFSMTKFIRYHWLSKYEFLTVSKLFAAVEKKLQKEKALTWQQFLDDLVDDSNKMRRLTHPQEEDYSELNSPRRVTEALEGISLMGVTQVYVLLLSLIRNFSMKKKWELDIEFLENFCFRYHAVGKGQAVRVEKLYSEYARKIEGIRKLEGGARVKKLNKTLDALKNELSALVTTHVPKDLFVEQFIREIQYSTTPKKRHLLGYVLKKINSHLEGGTGEYKVDPRMVNFEHVLPQKPDQWGLDSGEIQEYVHQIGNLTLVSKKINSKIGNKPISGKLNELKKSELSITKGLVNTITKNNEKWDESAIVSRGHEMATMSFEKIWKI